MTDVELIKAALKELGDDATMAMVAKWVEAKKTLDAVASGEGEAAAEAGGEPPTAATRTEPDAVAATAAPAAEVVKATDAPPAAVQAMDEAAMGELSAVMTQMQTALGMDDATFLAALRDNAEAIAGILGGQPTSGTPADDASAMTRAKAAELALGLTKARVEAHEAQITALKTTIAEQAAALGKLSSETDEQRIDAAIRAGHFLAKHRPLLVTAAKFDRTAFNAQLAAGAESPAIITTDVATGKGSKPDETSVGETVDDVLEGPDLVAAERLLKRGMPVERIALRLSQIKGIPRERVEAQLRGLKNEGQA